MYHLREFADMMGDQVRMAAYTAALKRAVKPNSVVIDIGTGTGIFAFIACQLGARKVYAIEANPLIELGKPMAAANGFADRIVFIQDYSTQVTLPELADVVFGDLRGRLPFLFPNISTYYDAKHRLLKPDGILIPKQDRLYAAFISQPDSYTRWVMQPWADNAYQLDMRAALPMSVNTPIDHLTVTPEHIRLPGQRWETLDYGIRTDPNGKGVLEWQVEQAGRADFICLWFDAELIDGIGFSASPLADARPQVYGSSCLPLQAPLDLVPGQIVTLDLSARVIGQGYVYRWQTSVFADAAAHARQTALQRFDQSTFFTKPALNLSKRTLNFKPKLKRSGQVQAFILNQMQSGDTTLEAIVQAVQAAFPRIDQDAATLFEQVANLAESFSE